LFFIALNTS